MTDDPSTAFRALGHPRRPAIVRLLLERDRACSDRERPEDCRLDPASANVGELADRLEVAPSTTSHHPMELERAGLLERQREGRRLFCRVDTATLRLVWQWLREGAAARVGLAGGVVLVLYGVVPTFQPAHFGRVYAAHGGVFVVASLLWGWWVDGRAPDGPELVGGLVCLVAVAVIMYWPRA